MPSLRHVISAEDFDQDFLVSIFQLADTFRDVFTRGEGGRDRLAMMFPGMLLKYVFFEPSSRTRMSFEDGAIHLGMKVSGTDSADKFSSFAKYEAIEPAFRTMSGYRPDIIVVRSKKDGDVARAARFSRVPVINAGDGSGEHPTQALLDLYTIWCEYGRLDNLVIGLGGDLARGRTVHSLVQVLSKFPGNSFILTSPSELRLPEKYKALLRERGCKFQEFEDHREAMPLADWWYWTRCQFEREQDEQRRAILFEKAKKFTIDVAELELMKETAILLHPQPIDERIWEVSKAVIWPSMLPLEERDDLFKKVRIFEQSDNGLWSRMALIFWIIRGHFIAHL